MRNGRIRRAFFFSKNLRLDNTRPSGARCSNRYDAIGLSGKHSKKIKARLNRVGTPPPPLAWILLLLLRRERARPPLDTRRARGPCPSLPARRHRWGPPRTTQQQVRCDATQPSRRATAPFSASRVSYYWFHARAPSALRAIRYTHTRTNTHKYTLTHTRTHIHNI